MTTANTTVTTITSPQNPRVKHVASLRDKRQREQDRLMVVEGYDELSMALACGACPLTVYYCPACVREPAQMALVTQARSAGVELVEVGERVFAKMAYRDGPDGWLGIFPLIQRSLPDLRLSPNPLLLVAEAVEKPGNLGAMLRTADAAGVDALISCDPNTDLGNPNVVRSSKGALFSVPVAEANTADTIAWLRDHGIAIVAASPDVQTPHGVSIPYAEADLCGPIAIAVGAEKPGLSAVWLRAADLRVRIPMVGRVNSLNVATSAALLIYEAVKQRHPQMP